MRRPSRRKNSTKIFLATTLVALLALVGAYHFISTRNEVVVAKVNGEKIFKSEVERKLRSVFDSESFAGQTDLKIPELESLPSEVLEILVKEIYLEKELTKEAKKSDIAKSPEIKGKIDDVEGKILRQAYVNSLLEQEVTDQKVSEKYTELSGSLAGKKEYQVSHIITKTKEEAEKISHELKAKKPAKFSDLAKKHSLDRDSAEKGGDLGYILEDNLVKEISEIASTLKKDEVSAPIQTKFGWHLVKISDSREAKPLEFEAVKDNIRDQLTQEKINEINSKITKDAKIEILVTLVAPKASETEAETKVEESQNSAEVQSEAATETSQDKTELVQPSEESETPNSEKTEEPKPTEEKPAKKADKKSDAKAKNKSAKKHR